MTALVNSVRRLVHRLRHGRSRGDELSELSRRLRRASRHAPQELAQEAARLRRLREELAASIKMPDTCKGCAVGHSSPEGRWPGGHCCGGHTADVFTDAELASLALGGTTARHWRPPTCDHAGCLFRGPTGCSLDPGDRTNLCARYFCTSLTRELHGRGDLAHIEALRTQLDEAWTSFASALAHSDR